MLLVEIEIKPTEYADTRIIQHGVQGEPYNSPRPCLSVMDEPEASTEQIAIGQSSSLNIPANVIIIIVHTTCNVEVSRVWGTDIF